MGSASFGEVAHPSMPGRVPRHLIFILRGSSTISQVEQRKVTSRAHAMPAPIRHHRALGEPVAIEALPTEVVSGAPTHCGEGRRHLGETVCSRCRGVARSVAPFTRCCHLGRIGFGGHAARVGCTLAHLVAADAVGGR